MRPPRGFSLAEVVLAAAVAALALGVLYATFRSSAIQAAQSRNRTVALILARTLREEVAAHPYGTPAPASWSREEETPLRIWVHGAESTPVFHKKLSFQTGGLVGDGEADHDVVTLELWWEEGAGGRKTLAARFPVRRATYREAP